MKLAKQYPTTDEVYILCLATHNGGNTVFNVTTLFCELYIFQEVLNFAKQSLTTEEVKELLSGTVNGKKRSSFWQQNSVQ
jgi:Tfp pilus assembly ATPase PilU